MLKWVDQSLVPAQKAKPRGTCFTSRPCRSSHESSITSVPFEAERTSADGRLTALRSTQAGATTTTGVHRARSRARTADNAVDYHLWRITPRHGLFRLLSESGSGRSVGGAHVLTQEQRRGTSPCPQSWGREFPREFRQRFCRLRPRWTSSRGPTGP